MIGINLEAYVTKGNEVIAGISSKYDDIYFSALFSTGLPEAVLMDTFALYDCMLVIENGNLSCHW